MAHSLSFVVVLAAVKLARIPPAFVYWLFYPCQKLCYLGGNRWDKVLPWMKTTHSRI